MTTTRTRLPAAQRREALIDAALCAFTTGSYRGTTTAEIARGAGVSEPILYRHFDSKRDLYLACLDAAWRRVKALWEEALDAEPNPASWLTAMARAYLQVRDRRTLLVELWVHALTEAGDDAVMRRALRDHLREVHGFVADVIKRAQSASGYLGERDAEAEAWIWVSFGLIGMLARRLPGLVDDALDGIFAARRQWMTGERASS